MAESRSPCRAEFAQRREIGDRWRTSRTIHTREVPGSIPGAPITKSLQRPTHRRVRLLAGAKAVDTCESWKGGKLTSTAPKGHSDYRALQAATWHTSWDQPDRDLGDPDPLMPDEPTVNRTSASQQRGSSHPRTLAVPRGRILRCSYQGSRSAYLRVTVGLRTVGTPPVQDQEFLATRGNPHDA